MWLLFPLLSLWAVAPHCVAMTAVEASQLLWYYTSYDLDFEVEGRNRTIARGCKGSGEDNKCNFNEFLNYVQTSEPTSEPKYFEVTSDFSFYVGDVGAILNALMIKGFDDGKPPPTLHDRMIKGVESATAMSRSLSRIASKNYKVAKAQGKKVERATNNMKVALSSVAHQAQVQAEAAMIESLKKVKDLSVKTKKRTSQLAKDASDRIDWRGMVEANKELANRGSQLFKDVANSARNVRNTDAMMKVRTFANEARSLSLACIG